MKKQTSIDYFGQQPPGMKAELFAPGIVSTEQYEHSSPAFSPDGTVVLWTVLDSTGRAYLLEKTRKEGKWSPPSKPSFADPASDDYYPCFSVDGKKLFFSSRRKLPAGYPAVGDMRLWQVERKENSWADPVPLDTLVSKGHEYGHSSSANGTIYFSAALGGGTNWNIQRSERRAGRYDLAALLPYDVNSVGYEEGPCIAPDESFLIFESYRPFGKDAGLGLYISFRQPGGSWGMPVNMGPAINSGKGERFARLSPDGKYLFFGSFRNNSPGRRGADIYWIDANIINELKKKQGANTGIDSVLGAGVIKALYENDAVKSTELLKRWLDRYPHNPDAAVIYSSSLRKLRRYQDAGTFLTGLSSMVGENAAVIMEKALAKFGMKDDTAAIKLLKTVLNTEGEPLRERYSYLSNALFEMGLYNISDRYFEKAMLIRTHGVFWYNRACGYARINQPGRAFTALDEAIKLGYDKRKDYQSDPDLEPLKKDKRWAVLVKQLREG